MKKTTKYFNYKQQLLNEAGAKTQLVPDNQIEPIPEKVWKSIYKGLLTEDINEIGDTDICPYCIMHNHNCKKCIMEKKDNNCKYNDDSTYEKVVDELGEGSIVDSIPDIIVKIRKFLKKEIL